MPTPPVAPQFPPTHGRGLLVISPGVGSQHAETLYRAACSLAGSGVRRLLLREPSLTAAEVETLARRLLYSYPQDGLLLHVALLAHQPGGSRARHGGRSGWRHPVLSRDGGCTGGGLLGVRGYICTHMQTDFEPAMSFHPSRSLNACGRDEHGRGGAGPQKGDTLATVVTGKEKMGRSVSLKGLVLARRLLKTVRNREYLRER